MFQLPFKLENSKTSVSGTGKGPEKAFEDENHHSESSKGISRR